MSRYILFLSLLVFTLMMLFYFAGFTGMVFRPAFTWWLLPLVFFSIALAGHGLMLRAIQVKPEQFMIFFLLATTVKMLLYLALLLVWFIISGQQLEFPFLVAFAILYVTITALDLIFTLSFRKLQN